MNALRPYRLAILARLVVAALIAVFAWPTLGEACCFGLQAVAVQWTEAASADDCCADEAASDDGGRERREHSGPCSCPLACASGCVGVGRALAAAPTFQLIPPDPVVLADQLGRLALPQAPDPHDILHVPKRFAA